jgi:hypothetical protein
MTGFHGSDEKFIWFDVWHNQCYDFLMMNTLHQQRFFSFFFFTNTTHAVFAQEVVLS